MPESKRLQIAIDGPAGAGKSTVARLVAEQLGYLYIDSGAMYRAVTWGLLQKGVNLTDAQAVAVALGSMLVELLPGQSGWGSRVFINGADVTDFIRSAEVSRNVAVVAAQPAVRNYLVQEQKRLCAAGGVVMDGRDIGSVVLPQADIKIFLTASLAERARRRCAEMGITLENSTEYTRLMYDIAARDQTDRQREISPLCQAADAICLESTGLSIQQVVDLVLTAAKEAVGKG